ncbi:30S ribosomal protein S5 [Candidatus Marinamargulisbacteria bacterium SCGC AAA071-K20]|nr:30S ribosomal protein S5 [Candidatus Marinamargulisbacteria bacterium SCGC AAA071-K20]
METNRNNHRAKVDDDNTDIEKVIRIDRVNKVVKGGKRLAFRAVVVTGDQKGKVGFGLGKSKEVPIAIKKAIERANKSRKKINIIGGTIPHPVIGKFGSSTIVLRPARPGTGVIAGGAVRILLEALGVRNIVAKSIGSGNAVNALQATLNGLLFCKDLEQEEKSRGKKLPVFFHKDETPIYRPKRDERRDFKRDFKNANNKNRRNNYKTDDAKSGNRNGQSSTTVDTKAADKPQNTNNTTKVENVKVTTDNSKKTVIIENSKEKR